MNKIIETIVLRNDFDFVKRVDGYTAMVYNATAEERAELKKSPYFEKSGMFSETIYSVMYLGSKGTTIIYIR